MLHEKIPGLTDQNVLKSQAGERSRTTIPAAAAPAAWSRSAKQGNGSIGSGDVFGRPLALR